MNHTYHPYRIGRTAAYLLLCIGVALPLSAQHGTLVDSQQTSKGESDWIYYDLGCDAGPWSGYFLPSHWDRRGGENLHRLTRPAPRPENGGIQFSGSRPEAEQWTIAVPARGFLSFELEGPDSLLDGVGILVNGVDQAYRIESGQTLISPFLSEGDDFTLHLPPGGSLAWNELAFHTNASGVFFYPEEQISRYRFRPVAGDRIDRVLFPIDTYGGWPLFDYDGDLDTAHDQQELREDTDRFVVEFQDRIRRRPGGYVLMRVFTVRENCEGGNSIRREVPWIPLPLLEPESPAE